MGTKRKAQSGGAKKAVVSEQPRLTVLHERLFTND
jgi:hypothetical protein